jgi:hypothetical protein
MPSVRYLNRRAPGWVRALLAGLALCGASYAVLLVGAETGWGWTRAPGGPSGSSGSAPRWRAPRAL